MTVEAKDQVITTLENHIKNSEFDKAFKFLKEQNFDRPIELFNEAFINFAKEDFVEAKYLLFQAKKSGLVTDELLMAMDQVNLSLGVSDYYTNYETFLLEYKMLPEEVFMTSFLGIASLIFLCAGLRKWLLSFLFSVLTLSLAGFHFSTLDKKLLYTTEETQVLKGPSKIFETTAILPAGVRIIVTKQDSGWSYIDLPQEYKGWVKDLKKVKKL